MIASLPDDEPAVARPATLEEAEAEVDAALRAGEHLSAYDRARRALKAFPGHPGLRYRAVLALARGGATEPAMACYREFGLAASHDPDVRALGPRLIKDRAMAASGAERRRLADRSSRGYEALWRDTGRYHPGVNAATMALVGGDAPRAQDLALALLDRALDPAHGDDGSYWFQASRSEALLVLGDVDAAAAALAEAARRDGGPEADAGTRGVTRRQLRLIAAHAGRDAAFLAELPVPAVIHYTGHMLPTGAGDATARLVFERRLAERVRAILDQRPIGHGHGSLACGADIIVAEVLLERGAQLHVVLPFDAESFKRRSVRAGGPGWAERFDRCLAAAASVTYTADRAYPSDDLDFRCAAHRAMGRALLQADQFDGEAAQLAVWDGGPATGDGGTAVDVADWAAGARPQIRVECPWRGVSATGNGGAAGAAAQPGRRRFTSVVFGDFAGFSRLDDVQYRVFFEAILGRLGRAIDRYGEAVLYRNTWGDALKLMFDSPAAALRCGLDLQGELATLDLGRLGLPRSLALRLSGDFGPTVTVYDGVRRTPKFAGAVMTRAARIEPITPPGRIYVTEALATELLLAPRPGLRCDYAGRVPTAKGYGELPLYLVRRRADPLDGPEDGAPASALANGG